MGQLLDALQACAPYALTALRDGDAAAAEASSKAATVVTAALLHRAANSPAETAAEELANVVRSALAEGPTGHAADLKAGLSRYDAAKDAPLTLGDRCVALSEELGALVSQGKGDDYCDEVQARLRIIAEDIATSPESYE